MAMLPAPPIATTIDETRRTAGQWRAEGRRIGFVPTMGALHEGHVRLVSEAAQHVDKVVVSIFVNPTQFGPNEDFSRYPRTLEADRELLAQHPCHLIFLPTPEIMYPEGFESRIQVPALSDVLDGVHRPGHFDGVATVVAKLLNIVQPDAAFFGEKDFQQLTIIRRMVQDLNLPIEIRGVATVREVNGLALSSRNRYLSAEEREIAPKLYRTLCMARENILRGADVEAVLAESHAWLLESGFGKVDYFDVRHADTLKIPYKNNDIKQYRLLTAAWLGKTRLIDNIAI